jgi:predicted nuclease with TOPRIM domain
MRKKLNKMKKDNSDCIDTATLINTQQMSSNNNIEVLDSEKSSFGEEKAEDKEVHKWLKTGWDNKESK